MPDMTPDTLLSNLIASLNSIEIKSKQAAFNLNVADLEAARQILSWEVITTHLNTKTGNTFTKQVVSNMYRRARPRVNASGGMNVIPHKNSVRPQIETEDEINNQNSVSWNNTGISNQRLIDDLVEEGLKPEQVIAWGCPNDTERRKKLTELIRTKQRGR